MHTSYFLFVMVITMFCYAVIKGRPSKLRQNNPEFCPEKVSSGWVCLAPGDRPFSRKKKGPGIMIAVLKSLLESSWVPLYLQSFLQHRSRAAESCQGLLPVTRDVAWLVECWPHMHEAIGSVFSTK